MAPLPLSALVATFGATVTALAWVSTFSTHVGAGDAPESAAGARGLGVLHAPGYFAYVLVAAPAAALGDAATGLNVLSLLAMGAAAVAVWRLSRLLGAPSWAATIGALGFSLAASTWFYSSFAKHNALSVAGIGFLLIGAVDWSQTGSRRGLVIVAISLGLAVGLAWAPIATVLPGVALLVALGGRCFGWRPVIAAVAGSIAVAAAVLGLLVLRAHADPAINWGDATSPRAVVDLVSMRDFAPDGPTPSGVNDARSVSSQDLTGLPGRVANYGINLWRDLGPLPVILAGAGFISLYGRSRRLAGAVGLVVIGNLVVVAALIGVDADGFEAVITQGSFTAPTLVALAALSAVGLAATVEHPVERVRRTRGLRRGERVRALRTARYAGLALAVAVAAGIVVPSVVTHRPVANHRHASYATRYADDTLEELPRRALLIVWGAERAFPLLMRQEVDRRRLDVTVVMADALATPWYPRQLCRQLALEPCPIRAQDARTASVQLIDTLAPRRPVYLDAVARATLATRVGYRPVGLTAKFVSRTPGLRPPTDPRTLDRRLEHLDQTPGLTSRAARRWPNWEIVRSYASAHVVAANAAGRRHDLSGQRHHLKQVLRIDPHNPAAVANLAILER